MTRASLDLREVCRASAGGRRRYCDRDLGGGGLFGVVPAGSEIWFV
jgi:hypothetical protein